jgi:hypothetical protein
MVTVIRGIYYFGDQPGLVVVTCALRYQDNYYGNPVGGD